MSEGSFFSEANDWLRQNLKWIAVLLLIILIAEANLISNPSLEMYRLAAGSMTLAYAIIQLWRVRRAIDQIAPVQTTYSEPLTIKAAIYGVLILLFRIVFLALAVTYFVKAVWYVRPQIISSPEDPTFFEILLYCTKLMTLGVLSFIRYVTSNVRTVNFDYFDKIGGPIAMFSGVIWSLFVYGIFNKWIALSRASIRNLLLVPGKIGRTGETYAPTEPTSISVKPSLFWVVLLVPLAAASSLSLLNAFS